MGGEWLFCDVIRNDYTGKNDHKIRTTRSPHVSFSSYSFVTRQKNKPSETEIHRWWISYTSPLRLRRATSPQGEAFCLHTAKCAKSLRKKGRKSLFFQEKELYKNAKLWYTYHV